MSISGAICFDDIGKKIKQIGLVMTRPAIFVFTSGGVVLLRIDKRIVSLFLQELVELRILLV